MQQYSAIFNWLLSLKRVAMLMRNLWSELGSLSTLPDQATSWRSEAGGSSGWSSPIQQRLRLLQLFRHEAAHFAGVLQAYMQGQLLGTCWQQLQNSIKVSSCIAGHFVCTSRSCCVARVMWQKQTFVLLRDSILSGS